jgi:uncharacterized protein
MKPTYTFKIVVAGPFGVGKTTFLHQLSMTPVVGVDVPTTGADALVKEMTTVGIEYGLYTVEDDSVAVELLLYGTPGQQRFAAVRAVAASSMDAMILLVDASNPQTWSEAGEILRSLCADRPVRVIIGLNRWSSDIPPEGFAETLGYGTSISAVPCQIIDRTSAVDLLVHLLGDLLDDLTVTTR